MRYCWNRHVQKLPWENEVWTKVLFVWSYIPRVAESNFPEVSHERGAAGVPLEPKASPELPFNVAAGSSSASIN